MNKVLAALQYFPLVLQGVVSVEQALKGAPGATKKQMLLNSILAVSKVGEQVPEGHVELISHLADLTVETLNQSGVFTHGEGKGK